MKKYIIFSFSLLFATGVYAQKNEIRAMKRILDKSAPTEADYKQLQGLIDTTTPYIGNASAEEQAEFYFYKGNFELQQALKANSVQALTKAVESFNRLKSAEENAKRKTFSDKLDREVLPVFSATAFQKGVEMEGKKRYREASQIFKAMYDLDKDPNNLYYAASTAVSAPDYNTALEYYQELLDMNYTGEGIYYTAINKKTGKRESFGDNKTLMNASVKSGEYAEPKQEKSESRKPQILKNMVLIYTEVGQTERASKLLADARKESPKDIDLIITEANFHIQNNNMEKAESLISEAVSIDPDNYELIYTLGRINAQADKTDAAKDLYERVLQINPKYTEVHISLGELMLKDEDKYITQMNAITGFSSAELKKYDDLKKQRDEMYRKAIPHFEKALTIEPENQRAISYLVGLYGALDMTDKQQIYQAKLKN